MANVRFPLNLEKIIDDVASSDGVDFSKMVRKLCIEALVLRGKVVAEHDQGDLKRDVKHVQDEETQVTKNDLEVFEDNLVQVLKKVLEKTDKLSVMNEFYSLLIDTENQFKDSYVVPEKYFKIVYKTADEEFITEVKNTAVKMRNYVKNLVAKKQAEGGS